MYIVEPGHPLARLPRRMGQGKYPNVAEGRSLPSGAETSRGGRRYAVRLPMIKP
jgi:hypothetical protein